MAAGRGPRRIVGSTTGSAVLTGRRLAAALAVGISGVMLIVLFMLTPDRPGVPIGPRSAASPSLARPPGLQPLAPLEASVTVVDGRFDGGVDRSVRSPTGHKNQSKLFFADGSWWGVLHEPVSREARLHRLDWATQRWHDTGVVVDERPYARADVLFVDDRLYVASAGSSDSPSHAVRVSTFTYEAAEERWSADPDFPVTVSTSGVGSPVIDRTASGVLWVSYIASGRLLVTHSLDDIHRWTAPFMPNVANTEGQTDQVGMAIVGDELLLLWSHQEDESIYVTSHREGDSDDAWADASVVIGGFMTADDHLNVKTLPDGRVFAVIKTSLDTVPASQPGWDQILLLDRTDGRWSSQQFGQLRDKHTRPIVLLDTEHDEAIVFATSPTGGGAIFMKHAPFDRIRFPVGLGELAILAEGLPDLNDATSTKQPVDASTGLVVLASDDSTRRYVHLAASLGGPAPGRPAAGPPPDGPEPAGPEPIDIVSEPYDAFPIGDPVQPMWEMSPTRADGTVRYVRRGSDDVAVQVRTGGTGELRPCRGFATTRSGSVVMGSDVRLDAQGAEDTVLMMARGDGQELGGLRVDDQMRIRVSSESGRETTNVRIEPGTWYSVAMTLDVRARTFEVRLSDAAGRVLVSRSGLTWRGAGSSVVDGMCVAASRGGPGRGLTFDEVRVTRTP